MLTKDRVCVFVIDGKINRMSVHLFSNDSKINNATIKTWKEHKCNLRRRTNSDRWITHLELSMAVRFEFRQEENTKEENRSQALDLSTRTDRHCI
jgi:hypothetical protein